MTRSARPSLTDLKDLPWFSGARVLCWVNSTEERDPAVRVATHLATMNGGSCQVLMCLDGRAPGAGERGRGGRPAPLTPAKIDQAGRALARLYGRKVQTMVVPGRPTAELRRFVRNHTVDLVIMGEQGLRLERECGERMCDDIPCPMLILAPPSAVAAGESREMPAPREREGMES